MRQAVNSFRLKSAFTLELMTERSTCRISFLSERASSYSRRPRPMRVSARSSEGALMIEPAIGLAVALLLGLYLVYTLLHPEKF